MASRHPTVTQSYQDRAALPNTSPVAAYLLRLIAAKKTNLCVSADVSTTRELLHLAEQVGDSICLLKTHADIINDFGPRTIEGLKEIAAKKHFLIFEDRKFGDIGSTVQKQFTAGPLQIARWAHIVNAHIFPGPAIITALSSAANDAVTALHTAVTTSISASPNPLYLDDSDEQDSPLSSHDDSDDGDRLSSDDDGQDADLDDDKGGLSARQSMFNDPYARKPSVVSVSTTISTMTESISPLPTPTHLGPTSSGSSASPDRPHPNSALAGLGEPPHLRGLLLLAEMSSQGNLMTGAYTQQCLEEARKDPKFVMGFIAQRSLNERPGDNFITMTPGVQIGATGDGLGQQYNTPEKVVSAAGTDIIIVGRGIYAARDKRATAEEYRRLAWKAYEARIGHGTSG